MPNIAPADTDVSAFAPRPQKNGMTLVRVAIGDPLAFPSDLCCNCGGTGDAVRDVVVKLPFAELAGESVMPAAIPHCDRCRPTAGREPRRFGAALQVFVGLCFVSIFLLGGLMHVTVGDHALPLYARPLAAPIVGLGGTLYLFRRRVPLAGQTSAYCAVVVCKVERNFMTGAAKSADLGFTNSRYATRFAETMAAVRRARLGA